MENDARKLKSVYIKKLNFVKNSNWISFKVFFDLTFYSTCDILQSSVHDSKTTSKRTFVFRTYHQSAAPSVSSNKKKALANIFFVSFSIVEKSVKAIGKSVCMPNHTLKCENMYESFRRLKEKQSTNPCYISCAKWEQLKIDKIEMKMGRQKQRNKEENKEKKNRHGRACFGFFFISYTITYLFLY